MAPFVPGRSRGGWSSRRRTSAKLLGLNPPQRREITVFSEDAIDAEIKRLEAQLGELPPAASREVKGS